MAARILPTDAELKLITAAKNGTFTDYTTGDEKTDDPENGEDWDDSRTIRAEIIYDLCTGHGAGWPVHPKGVQVIGAKISGSLDFDSANLRCPLVLLACHIAEPIILLDARAQFLSFNRSVVSSVWADRLRTGSNIHLRGTKARGEVRLAGAYLGGQLSCTGGIFKNPDRKALDGQGLVAKGGVFLSERCVVEGEVSLSGAEIGGQLSCSGGNFKNPDGYALIGQGLAVKGGGLSERWFRGRRQGGPF